MEEVKELKEGQEELEGDVWKEVEEIRKFRRRRYGRAAFTIAIGLFLFNVALVLFLSGYHIGFLSDFATYLIVSVCGAVSFGYGFYVIGVG